MPRFGQFETVDELASAGPVTVYSARKVDGGGEAQYVVKTFRARDEFADAEFTEAAAARFLEVVKVIQSLSDGNPGWAPVHEAGREGDFAFWVTDLYPSTLDRLIESRREVDLSGVVRITRGILDGLITLRDKAGGRGHGHLRPTDVMLSAADPNDADVYLVDPVAPGMVEANAAGEDLRALGGFLYQLVCRKPPPKGGSVQRGAEWLNLGPAGEKLRVLCEHLLNPQVTGALTLEQIAGELKTAASAGTGKSKKPILISGVLLLLAAGAVGVYFFTRKPPPPPPPGPIPQFTREKDGSSKYIEIEIKPTDAKSPDPRTDWKVGIQNTLTEVEEAFAKIQPQLVQEGDGGKKDLDDLTQSLKGIQPKIDTVIGLQWDRIEDSTAPGGARDPKNDAERNEHHQSIVTLLNEVGNDIASISAAVKNAVVRSNKARIDYLDASIERYREAPGVKLQDVRDAVRRGLNKIPRDDPTVGWGETRARVEGIINWGKTLEDQLGWPKSVTVPPELNASDVNAALDSKQTELMDTVLGAAKVPGTVKAFLENGKAPVVDDAGYKAKIDAARGAMDTWVKAAEAALQDAASVKALLALGYGHEEAGPSGGTIKLLAERAASDKAILKDLSSAIADTLNRAKSLGELGSKNDAPALLKAISDHAGVPDDVSMVISAWLRLRTAPYPVKAADLAEATRTLSSQIAPAIGKIANADRKKAMLDKSQSELRAMWFDFVHQRAGADVAEVETAFETMGDLGVTEAMLADRLEPFAAFNYERWKLANAAKDLKPKDGQDAKGAVQGAVNAFDAAIAAEKFKDVTKLKVANVLLNRVLKSYRDGKYFVAQEEGPGVKGWKGESQDENDNLVKYSWEKGEKKFELYFGKIPEQSRASSVTYLCTTEVSLALFTHLVDEEKRWEEFKNPDNFLVTSRLGAGPIVWQWSDTVIKPSFASDENSGRTGNGWFQRKSSVEIPSYYPPDLNIVPPSPASPMNRISATGAAVAAALAGCRLPTPAEWKHALGMTANARMSANVRDLVWAKAMEYRANMKQMTDKRYQDAYASAEWPNGGRFRSSGESNNGGPSADIAIARTDSDNWLWFRPVPDMSKDYTDLIGNVAEWVFDNPDELVGAGDLLDRIKGVISKKGKICVIGGSAISPPQSEQKDEEALQPSNPPERQNYSDVGFRLAFTARGSGGGANPAPRLVEDLRKYPYLTANDK